MKTDPEKTMQSRIQEFNIWFKFEQIDERPDKDEWSAEATHWVVWIQVGKRRFKTYYSQGSAYTGEPKPEDVLECLVSDAQAAGPETSFENFCDDFGYDTDSRKAERVYKACQRTGKHLKRLLGEEAYDTLLWQTERDT